MKYKQAKSPCSMKVLNSNANNKLKIEELEAEGLALHNQGMVDKAVAVYKFLLKIDAKNFTALQLLGTAYLQSNNYLQAIKFFNKAFRIRQDFAPLYNNCGNAYLELNQYDKAIECYKKAISLQEDYADSYYNYGNALKKINKNEEAVSYYEKAIDYKNDFVGAYLNKGNALKDLGRFSDAVKCYQKAIELRPEFAEAYNNLGSAFASLNNLDDAIQSYDKAIKINPNYAEAFSNYSIPLRVKKRYKEALLCCEHAIHLDPNFAEGYLRKAEVLKDLKKLTEAADALKCAFRYREDFHEAYLAYAFTLSELKEREEAIKYFNKVLDLKPDSYFILGLIMHLKMQIADWNDFEKELSNILEKVASGKYAIVAFALMALVDSPLLIKYCAVEFLKNIKPAWETPPVYNVSDLAPKIKVGYYSSDYMNHPVSHLVARIFELHDRNRFEIYAFSINHTVEDGWQSRIRNGVDHFVDVSNKSDVEIAELSRILGIAIAIDLNGETQGARPGIFVNRAAPIQASYIGYLGTMGHPCYDYLIADRTIIPTELQSFYAEKIAYIPSYQCNDELWHIPDNPISRTEYGLPEDAFVYCSFNNNYKITPDIFDCWMRVLLTVPNSVLWIYADNATSKKNISIEAEKRGLSPSRLIFADRLPLGDHLSRLRLADLFLDTFPYNGGATTSNALRMNLPFVTLSGDSFCSRYGASLLNAIGTPELITDSLSDYESLAIQLAKDSIYLSSIKLKISNNVKSHPLFDTSRFVRSLEDTYISMYERYINNLPADHIFNE